MNIPFLIEDNNLSSAWYRAFQQITNNPGTEITPLVLTLTSFEESDSLRAILDLELRNSNLDSVDTVSETIFPTSLYQICGYDRDVLYKRYIKNLPRIKRIDNRNSKGTYFERLIAYDNTRKEAEPINQLDIIITSLRDDSKVKRRSKLQASIFDPRSDHTNGMFQGFPCLQHVTFYKSESGGLIINSFYAIQYLYQRAYGNWLGLINLGKFVAREANIELERFNCFVGVEILDHLTKEQAKALIRKV